VAAAKIRIAAFTKKARSNSRVDEVVFQGLFNSSWYDQISGLHQGRVQYKLCGITVAPIIPMAMYKAWLGHRINPINTLSISGCANIISKINETPITKTKVMMNASIFRMPLLIKKQQQNVSKPLSTLRQSMKYQRAN
jgi:hypothetical protein